MRYLKKTKDYMVTYKRLDNLEIIGYSNYDFFGCQDSRISTSGYIYMLVGGAISWHSCKTRVNLFFFPKNGKIVNCHSNTGCRL